MNFKNLSPTKVLRLCAGFAAACVIIPVVGNFSVVYAGQLGWYDNPVKTVHAVLSFVGYPWFHWLGGAILGLAIGVWIDASLRKSEDAGQPFARPPRETMVRFEKDRSSPFKWNQVVLKNAQVFQIWNYKPAVMIKEFSAGGVPNADIFIPELFPKSHHESHIFREQIDTFYFSFEKPIKYKNIKIESFGHVFPPHDFYFTTPQTAIIFMREPFPQAMTVFEVSFVD